METSSVAIRRGGYNNKCKTSATVILLFSKLKQFTLLVLIFGQLITLIFYFTDLIGPAAKWRSSIQQETYNYYINNQTNNIEALVDETERLRNGLEKGENNDNNNKQVAERETEIETIVAGTPPPPPPTTTSNNDYNIISRIMNVAAPSKIIKTKTTTTTTSQLNEKSNNGSNSNSNMNRMMTMKNKEKKLVIFNALGRRDNLFLVEHARNYIFPIVDDWSCIAYMYVDESIIPDDDRDLVKLRDFLHCTIIRTPGIMWGNFIQFVPPDLVTSYEYITIVLDDIFIPHQGPTPIYMNKLITKMKQYNISIISPALVGDTHEILDPMKNHNSQYANAKCIVDAPFIETYVQVFTRDAWNCYYSMLHHSGWKGWCYDICFTKVCNTDKHNNFKLAVDYSMVAYHMDKHPKLPESAITGTRLSNIEYTGTDAISDPADAPIPIIGSNKLKRYNYFKSNNDNDRAICIKNNCPFEKDLVQMERNSINCVASIQR